MPNCSETRMVCGKACTMEGGLAYYKDCKTGRAATGRSYDEVRKKTASCAGLTGETLKGCQSGKSILFKASPNRPRIHPVSKIKTVGSGKGGAGMSGELTVPIGSRFDDKPDNWKDTEMLLGDPEADEDPGTVGGFDKCFELPISCQALAIIGGAILVLLLVLRR